VKPRPLSQLSDSFLCVFARLLSLLYAVRAEITDSTRVMSMISTECVLLTS